MLRKLPFFVSVVSFLVAAAACGSATVTVNRGAASDGGADSGAADSGEDAGVDAGSPPATLPKVQSAGGPVLASPKVVVVTYTTDTLAPQIESFANAIGASSYWSATTAEYGVGKLTVGATVHVADTPPVTIETSALEAWLISQLDGTHPEWGTPDASTIYTIIYPPGTAVTTQGQSACSSSPAYHYEVQLASGLRVPYAAIARCDPFLGLNGIDFVTAGVSHEWVEASTDPFFSSNPAFNGPPGVDSGWTVVTGGEVADMCTLTPSVYFKPADLPYTVQRTWSNAAALAGHEPCVPAPSGAYFNAAPTEPDMVSAGGLFSALKVHGVAIPVGQSRTIDIALESDQQGTGPWTVTAADFGPQVGDGPTLKLAFDKSQGSAGDTLHLTITRMKKDTDLGGAGIFTLTSTSGTRQSAWVGVVGD